MELCQSVFTTRVNLRTRITSCFQTSLWVSAFKKTSQWKLLIPFLWLLFSTCFLFLAWLWPCRKQKHVDPLWKGNKATTIYQQYSHMLDRTNANNSVHWTSHAESKPPELHVKAAKCQRTIRKRVEQTIKVTSVCLCVNYLECCWEVWGRGPAPPHTAWPPHNAASPLDW